MKKKFSKVLTIISFLILFLAIILGIFFTFELLSNANFFNLNKDSEGLHTIMNFVSFLGIIGFLLVFIMYAFFINAIIWGCYGLVLILLKIYSNLSSSQKKCFSLFFILCLFIILFIIIFLYTMR